MDVTFYWRNGRTQGAMSFRDDENAVVDVEDVRAMAESVYMVQATGAGYVGILTLPKNPTHTADLAVRQSRWLSNKACE